MRLNGRMVAVALTGVLVAAGTTGGYLLTAGSARADNATQCDATPASGGICSLDDITLPATANIYLQLNPNVPSGDSAKADVTYTADCDGQTYSAVGEAAGPPDVVYIDQTYEPSCTVTASIQVFYAGTNNLNLASIIFELNYTDPYATSSPSPTSTSTSGSGSNSGGGEIKGYDGKCVDDAGNSSSLRAKVELWSCSGSDKAEKFTYSTGLVKHNGLCLNKKSNGNVILWTCDKNATNEIWVFNTINHEVILRAGNFKDCLTDPGYSKKNGTQLTVAVCKNTSNQHWGLP
jgi:hypothetical protein